MPPKDSGDSSFVDPGYTLNFGTIDNAKMIREYSNNVVAVDTSAQKAKGLSKKV